MITQQGIVPLDPGEPILSDRPISPCRTATDDEPIITYSWTIDEVLQSEALKITGLREADIVYNDMSEYPEYTDIPDSNLEDLARIFIRHNADTVFGVRRLDGHLTLPDYHALVGTTYGNEGLRWSKIMAIDSLNVSKVHGHTFYMGDDGLYPYEFETGPLPDVSEIGPGFLNDLARYLDRHCLRHLLGPRIMRRRKEFGMELDLPEGNVVLDASLIKNVTRTYPTSWGFELADGLPHVFCDQARVVSGDGSRMLVNLPHPLEKPNDTSELMAGLAEAGFIKNKPGLLQRISQICADMAF